LKIIRALQIDARASFTDLANDLGVSKNTISNRVKLLKENGIITNSILLLNMSKCNYGCIATIGLRVVPIKIEEVLNHLKQIKGAEICTETIGCFNIGIFVFIESTDALKKIIDAIKAEPAVLQVTTSIWTSVEKATANPQNIDLNKLLEANK
jgi:DNA-binding Lrp family transcriptional regulator